MQCLMFRQYQWCQVKLKNVTEPILKSYGNAKDVTDDEKRKKLQKKQSISQNKSTKNCKILEKLFTPIFKMSLFQAKFHKITQFQAGKDPFINRLRPKSCTIWILEDILQFLAYVKRDYGKKTYTFANFSQCHQICHGKLSKITKFVTCYGG